MQIDSYVEQDALEKYDYHDFDVPPQNFTSIFRLPKRVTVPITCISSLRPIATGIN